MLGRTVKIAALLAALSFGAAAHVGSPDIYLDGQAGAYRLFITVRPPTVIPGTAELEIRSETPGIREIRAVPLPLSGPGAQFAPIPDRLKSSPRDPQFFTGTMWMMASGSWQIRVSVDGNQGPGSVAVPVPSVALGTKKMQRGLGTVLSVLMTFLIFGLVAIVGASVREARLPAGTAPDKVQTAHGRAGMLIAFFVIAAVIWFGSTWWNSEANSYSQNVYKPLSLRATLDTDSLLSLTISESSATQNTALQDLANIRKVDDLVPDHNHLMHLYVIRQPGLDVVYHLHPELSEGGTFKLALPSMPSGNYQLYADIVHANGFPETLVSSLSVPGKPGRPLTGDDASAVARAWNIAHVDSTSFALPDGYSMQWIRPPGPLRSKQPVLFRFRLLNRAGQPPPDMALYMGMLGHAAFVKTDGSVFAHLHPTGTVSMAAFMQAQGQSPAATNDMAGMDMSNGSAHLPAEVSFPYGLPTPGRFRAFVQMKHGNTVETGIFDLQAD